MKLRTQFDEGARDTAFLAGLVTAAVLAPVPALAAQVGCFITAILLGMMFMIGIALTSIVKHLLAKYVWQVPRTPWLRLFGITWLELALAISVFAVIRTSFWLTVVLYLPFAVVLNLWLLAKVPSSGSSPFLRRYGIFLLFPLSLPLSIQIAGVIWSALTSLIEFTDLKV
jgi:hypothetical protein